MSLLQNSNAISAGGYDINNSLRFRQSASAFLSRTPASASNRQIWTWSGWVKRGRLGVENHTLFAGRTSASATYTLFYFSNTDTLNFIDNGGANLTTTQIFRDPSAWYHVVCAVDTTQATASNRVKLYVNGVQITAFATATYPTLNANLNVNSTATHVVGDNPGAAQLFDGYMAEINFTDGQALTPSSFGETDAVTGSWVAKKYTGTYGTNGFYLPFNNLTPSYSGSFNGSSQYLTAPDDASWDFGTGDFTIETFLYSTVAPSGGEYSLISNYLNASVGWTLQWRSTGLAFFQAGGIGSALQVTTTVALNQWHHIAVTRSGTTLTIYLNGASVGSTTSSTDITGSTSLLNIGKIGTLASQYTNGLLSNVRIVKGTALYTGSTYSVPTAPLTAATNTKLLTLQSATHVDNSTNSFAITNNGSVSLSTNSPFSNIGYGKDSSGNNNNWVANNLSYTLGTTYDAMIDVPTNTSATVANYAVLNPLYNTGALAYLPLSNGNLTATESSGSAAWRTRWSTIGMTSGKWYAEFTLSYAGTTSIAAAGTAGLGLHDGGTATYTGQTATTYGYLSSAVKYNNASAVAYGATYANGDIIGIAFDANAGTLTFYKNGTTQGTAYTSIPSGLYYFACSAYWTSPDGVATWNANFGQRPFTYTPPTGFLSLNTYNLPDSTIKKGNTVMDAVIYTGDGISGRAVNTTTGFRPDFAWAKSRSVVGSSNILMDSNRGNNKYLISESTGAEGTASDLTFTSTGVTWNNGASLNNNGSTYVNWFWQAGQGTTSTNTAGSITSTVSANPTAGFSIVTYTGTGANATVGHGLGVAPKMIICKSRTISYEWIVWHTGLTSAAYYINLNGTASQASVPALFQSTAPSSSVITLGTNVTVNASGASQLIYAWSEIAGFSKFGSYIGNGSTDGPFVYTGFRPKFIMVKRTDAVGDWVILDTTRSSYNAVFARLYPHLSQAEDTTPSIIDILSNGFKLRIGIPYNNSSGTYVYMAFAENPFKNSLAR